MLEQFEYEITRAGEDQSQEVGGRICSGRSPGSLLVGEGSCDLQAGPLEACRGSRLVARPGIHTEDVLAGEEEEGGSCQGQAGSCRGAGSHQGSLWSVDILRIIS